MGSPIERMMKRQVPPTVGVAVLVALYAAVSLWPYNDWQVRGWVQNAAEPLANGGVRLRKPGIVLAKAAPNWVEIAKRFQRLEILLRVRSQVQEQFGPARILTFSLNPYERNLTIGQQGADLVLRLRTAWTNANGTIGGRPVARVPRVFLTDHWVDLRILIEPGSLRVEVGDELLVDETLPPRPFETWDPSHQLALGNEITGTRPWLGEIDRAVVRAGGSCVNCARMSELSIPSQFLITGPPPKLVPLRQLNAKDAAKNLTLYLPLGFLFGFLLDSWHGGLRWRSAFAALLIVAAISTSMELLQFLFVPRRWPSVDDVIFNTLGGGLGLVLARWARRRFGLAA